MFCAGSLFRLTFLIAHPISQAVLVGEDGLLRFLEQKFGGRFVLDEKAMVVRITEFDPSGALRATATCFEHALRVCREGGAKVTRFHSVYGCCLDLYTRMKLMSQMFFNRERRGEAEPTQSAHHLPTPSCVLLQTLRCWCPFLVYRSDEQLTRFAEKDKLSSKGGLKTVYRTELGVVGASPGKVPVMRGRSMFVKWRLEFHMGTRVDVEIRV